MERAIDFFLSSFSPPPPSRRVDPHDLVRCITSPPLARRPPVVVPFFHTRTFLCLPFSSSLSNGTIDTQSRHKAPHQNIFLGPLTDVIASRTGSTVVWVTLTCRLRNDRWVAVTNEFLTFDGAKLTGTADLSRQRVELGPFHCFRGCASAQLKYLSGPHLSLI